MEFNQEQLQAIHSTAKNLLVLAGAGTGKTRTIVGRASHLVRQGTPAERIAIITFTRRSAHEIRQRLIRDAGDACKKVVTGTFHNFCLREMSSRRRLFGFEDLTIMDRDDQNQLMKLVRGDVIGKRKGTVTQTPQLLTYYSYARNTNQPVRDYLEKYAEVDSSEIEVILKIFDGYKQRKLESGYIDYDDILHRFAKVMREDQLVRSRVAAGYDHVLVDEMQDTNPLQWLILESLAVHANLFCVGDDAQSIYAFRGADFRNVHSFSERLPNSATLKLELNYRSGQPILDLANWLLSGSKLEYGKQLRAHRGDGRKPLLREFDSELDEAEWIVDSITEHHREGQPWKEQMVLCRTAYSARPIEAELIKRSIPYRFIGGMGLLQMAHVKDLLCAVRIAVNHRDELAWIRYLTLFPRIGEVTAARLISELKQCENSQQAILKLKELQPRPEVLEPLNVAHQYLRSPGEAIRGILKAMATLFESRYDDWDGRKRDVKLIERLAEKHQSLKGFLDTYTLDPVSASEADTEVDVDDRVTLITVHSAKGTESKNCYVAAAQPGNYPHSRSLGDEDAIEEERRVLYVAVTRAQDELNISRNFSRGSTRTAWNAPAPVYFLENIPRQLIESPRRAASTRFRANDASFWDDDIIN